SVVNEAGDFIFIPPDVPHQPINLSNTEPAIAIVARNDPDEQEHVILLPKEEAAPKEARRSLFGSGGGSPRSLRLHRKIPGVHLIEALVINATRAANRDKPLWTSQALPRNARLHSQGRGLRLRSGSN